MLTSSMSAANPIVEQLMKDLLKEDFQYVQNDRRSVVREHFVRPVSVTLGNQESFSAFSRDFSPAGIGLLSERPIKEKESAKLAIYRLKGKPAVVVAECRWCKPYGESWYLSGWQFLRLT